MRYETCRRGRRRLFGGCHGRHELSRRFRHRL